MMCSVMCEVSLCDECRDFVNTRLLVHKHVKISVDEWVLETTRPHKHVTIFVNFLSIFFCRTKLESNNIFFQHTSTTGDFNYKQEKRNFPHIIQYAPIKWFHLFKIVDKWISV